jgi:hypothetical protein
VIAAARSAEAACGVALLGTGSIGGRKGFSRKTRRISGLERFRV